MSNLTTTYRQLITTCLETGFHLSLETMDNVIKTVESLTPEEWWKYAPWQDINDSTPRKEMILAIDANKNMRFVVLAMSIKTWEKWLPLPEKTQ